jgi:hypothetical protein
LTFRATLKQLESFIGAANYNRTHIAHYASLIAPLEQLKRELLRESPAKGAQRKRYTSKFRLESPTEAQKASFQGIKDALSGPTMLIHYDNSVPLVIRMDASKERGYGAMITQIPAWSFDEEKKAATVLDPTAENYDIKMEKPVCYLSKRLNKHEMNYWPTELEVAGLVWTIRKIRHLVDDSDKVFVFTDHQATTSRKKNACRTEGCVNAAWVPHGDHTQRLKRLKRTARITTNANNQPRPKQPKMRLTLRNELKSAIQSLPSSSAHQGACPPLSSTHRIPSRGPRG